MNEKLKNSIGEVCQKYVDRVSEKLDNNSISEENAQESIRILLRIYNEVSNPVRKPTRIADQ